jgi:hypothetical protein
MTFNPACGPARGGVEFLSRICNASEAIIG